MVAQRSLGYLVLQAQCDPHQALTEAVRGHLELKFVSFGGSLRSCAGFRGGVVRCTLRLAGPCNVLVYISIWPRFSIRNDPSRRLIEMLLLARLLVCVAFSLLFRLTSILIVTAQPGTYLAVPACSYSKNGTYH